MRINKKNKRVTTVPLIVLVVGFVLILFTLINNNKSVPASNEEDTEQVTEIIETSTSNQEVAPSEITLDSGNGKTFNVPISSIPDLEKYLDDATDVKIELERIQVEYLDWNISDNDYFILNYGCGNKICDLVLLRIDKQNEVETIYLTSGSFMGSKVFEGKAMLRIVVTEGAGIARHQMLIIDLNLMDKLHPLNKNDDEYYFNSPLYPITEFKWISANTIELVVADIADTSYESLEKWYKALNPPVKSVQITIE